MSVAATELCIYAADSDILCFSKKVYAAENLALTIYDDIVSYIVFANVPSSERVSGFLNLCDTPALTVAISTFCAEVLVRLNPPLSDSVAPILVSDNEYPALVLSIFALAESVS